MPHNRDVKPALDRRSFIKASLIPAALPLVGVLARPAASAETVQGEGPDLIDSNVHLFQWPFRKLKYDRTEALLAKLQRHRIVQAWAGSFEAVLHKQLDATNRRLADECRTARRGAARSHRQRQSRPGPTGKRTCGAATSSTACPACGSTRPITGTRSTIPSSRSCSSRGGTGNAGPDRPADGGRARAPRGPQDSRNQRRRRCPML